MLCASSSLMPDVTWMSRSLSPASSSDQCCNRSPVLLRLHVQVAQENRGAQTVTTPPSLTLQLAAAVSAQTNPALLVPATPALSSPALCTSCKHDCPTCQQYARLPLARLPHPASAHDHRLAPPWPVDVQVEGISLAPVNSWAWPAAGAALCSSACRRQCPPGPSRTGSTSLLCMHPASG